MLMNIRSRVEQDRRKTSRVMARLACHFTHAGISHEAVIVDLSLKGAYLSSKFLPPNNSPITVSLEPPSVKKEIKFSGSVIRGTWAMSEHGKLGRFGVRFGATHLDLMMLITSLNS